MKRKVLIFMLVCIFPMTPLFGTAPKAEAQGDENDDKGAINGIQSSLAESAATAAEMKALVEQFEDKGAFESDRVAHALKIHLTAVDRYEKQDKSEKVVKHMKGFNILLGHQQGNELISENAYDVLTDRADALIQKWNSLVIVRDRQPEAVVVIPENADEETNESADILVEYVEEATGVGLPIIREEELEEENPDGQVRIYLGKGDFNEDTSIVEGLKDLNGDGYLIHPHDKHLTIVGPTELGTRNGVYDFLERYVGVRWLMPGDSWTDIPKKSDIRVPREAVREEPDFSFRSINMNSEDEEQHQVREEWKLQNRIQSPQQLQLGHNLYSLFPVEKYGETHPEFYPGGNPPAPDKNSGWQPCFTEEGTVEAAVDGLIEYFDNHPEATSYSLAVNDSGGYCEGDPSHPDYPDKINSVGVQDMSDIYYAWVNEVVERVLDVYPDKWFGAYAYQGAMDPPSFQVHPRVVPVITKDRLTWIDDEVRDGGHQHLEAWDEVTQQTGWYAYLYGYQYLVPRVYPHLMAENYRYAKEKNVMTHHADMHQVLGDGPKPWLSAKLQWDADQDVDALLQEWYERAVGPEAAPYLAEYYDLWETFWMERVKDSDWFHQYKNDTYLSLHDADYLHLVTEEDINESRRLLESVVDKAETNEQHTRAELMLRQFEYYEASALSYPGETDPPANEAEALDLLESGGKADLAQKRHELIESFKDDLSLRYPTDAFKRIDWSGWNSNDFWHLVDYMAEQEPNGGTVTDRVEELAQSEEPSQLREFAQLLLKTDLEDSMVENSSFEEGNGNAPPWSYWNGDKIGSMERVEGVAHTGSASLLTKGLARGGPHQTLSIQPGLMASRAYFYTPPGTEAEGTVHFFANLKDAQGDNLLGISSSRISLSDTVGEWSSVGLLEDIPDTIDGKEVKQVQVGVTVRAETGTQVYIDDLNVYQNVEKEVPSNHSAKAIKTSVKKDEVLQSLDFSVDPWVDAEPITTFFKHKTDEIAPVETKVYLLWDNENLYVGYENFDDNMSEMVVSDVVDGWWRGTSNDSAETHVSAGEGKTYAYFTNPETARFVYETGPTYLPDVQFEANGKLLSDRWNVIQVIPFTDFGLDPKIGMEFKALFVRNYHGSENFTWGGGGVWNPTEQNSVRLIEDE